MTYPSLHIGTCPCDKCNPEPWYCERCNGEFVPGDPCLCPPLDKYDTHGIDTHHDLDAYNLGEGPA